MSPMLWASWLESDTQINTKCWEENKRGQWLGRVKGKTHPSKGLPAKQALLEKRPPE